MLDIEDVLGKRIVGRGCIDNVTDPRGERDRGARGDEPLRGQSEVADLPAADHVAGGDADAPGLLEHPAEAFAYYRQRGRAAVVCEEKHMGSRAVVVVMCATRRPRADGSASSTVNVGICYTRTGRRFFDDHAIERELLARVRAAVDACRALGRARDRLGMPRLRADALVGEGAGAAPSQYAAVGAAAGVALPRGHRRS